MKKIPGLLLLCLLTVVFGFTCAKSPTFPLATNSTDDTQAKGSWTITFNANGGVGSMSVQSATVDTIVVLRASSFSRTNYVYCGWNTAADGTGTAYAECANYLMRTAGVTLYAQWYKIYVTGNGTNDLWINNVGSKMSAINVGGQAIVVSNGDYFVGANAWINGGTLVTLSGGTTASAIFVMP